MGSTSFGAGDVAMLSLQHVVTLHRRSYTYTCVRRYAAAPFQEQTQRLSVVRCIGTLFRRGPWARRLRGLLSSSRTVRRLMEERCRRLAGA